jgi:hypothetical protein
MCNRVPVGARVRYTEWHLVRRGHRIVQGRDAQQRHTHVPNLPTASHRVTGAHPPREAAEPRARTCQRELILSM